VRVLAFCCRWKYFSCRTVVDTEGGFYLRIDSLPDERMRDDLQAARRSGCGLPVGKRKWPAAVAWLLAILTRHDVVY
jgi:hypothetical protein